MSARLDYNKVAPDLLRAVYGAAVPLHKSTLGEPLLEMINLRASQLNGCALCLDLHARTLVDLGVEWTKINLVAGWREAKDFDARERAALAWTEALTRLDRRDIDEAYAQIKNVFSEREQVELTHAIGIINIYNRYNVAFQAEPMGLSLAQLMKKAS
ncbi:carboxymuconolactone decarboxylase family protein [Roseiterribacter gracilis]|uniref:Alkyl hydroperoxide reductase AhpD n=1 Tax=Roseiterribacter gracilis TaxID=2812848 RepID=A0A8S8XCQ8_9PROT|nr:alkyl hydroperoxide reductase AhpD [Rhodospirillales bacterium TMPK1]